MMHLIGRGVWRLMWDIDSARGQGVSSSITGITSQFLIGRVVITSPCSRFIKGSPRGVLSLPKSLIWWLTWLFGTGSHLWRDRRQEWTDLEIQWLVALFYADDGLLVSPRPARIQAVLDALMGLFDRVELHTNIEKWLGRCDSSDIFSAVNCRWITRGG